MSRHQTLQQTSAAKPKATCKASTLSRRIMWSNGPALPPIHRPYLPSPGFHVVSPCGDRLPCPDLSHGRNCMMQRSRHEATGGPDTAAQEWARTSPTFLLLPAHNHSFCLPETPAPLSTSFQP